VSRLEGGYTGITNACAVEMGVRFNALETDIGFIVLPHYY